MRTEIIFAIAVPLFLGVFVGFWSLIVLLIGYMSGWQRLATQYSSRDAPQGQFFPLESALINGTRYKNALTIGVTNDGLYMSPFFLFRIGHSALLIPWGAFQNLRTEKQWWSVMHTVNVDVAGHPPITLSLTNDRLANELQTRIAR